MKLESVRNGLATAVLSALSASGAPRWRAADSAPATVAELLESYSATGEIVVYAGASDATIFGAPVVNHAFRAWHDWCHIRTRIGFTVPDEVTLARWQAAEASSDALARIVLIEVAEQALHFGRTGEFLTDQIGFTMEKLS